MQTLINKQSILSHHTIFFILISFLFPAPTKRCNYFFFIYVVFIQLHCNFVVAYLHGPFLYPFESRLVNRSRRNKLCPYEFYSLYNSQTERFVERQNLTSFIIFFEIIFTEPCLKWFKNKTILLFFFPVTTY